MMMASVQVASPLGAPALARRTDCGRHAVAVQMPLASLACRRASVSAGSVLRARAPGALVSTMRAKRAAARRQLLGASTVMASGDATVCKEGDFVEVHFKGSLLDGTVFQNTQESGNPVKFKAGMQTVMPALDRAVIGMSVGASRKVTCDPSEAFGVVDEDNIFEVPMEKAPEGGVKVGQHLLLMANVTARVTKIDEEENTFTLDINHELAGETVIMELELVSVVDPNARFPLKKTDDEWRAQLGEEEFRVLREKGTEPARTGEYDKFYPEKGYFTCRACEQPLYTAQAKFDSGCGWPAFDKCFQDSVVTEVDTSGGMRRVEIMCSNCGGHLGHVFEGEGLTPTNERHCVNSISVKFVDDVPPSSQEMPVMDA